MPIDVNYLEDGGILVKGKGVVSGNDLAASNREIYQTPERVRTIAYQIVDLTDVAKIEFQIDQVKQLAEDDSRAAKINPDMLIAIVGKDDLLFGLGRMWEGYVDQPALKTSVFRRIEDAENWIASQGKNRQDRDVATMDDDKQSP